MARSRITRRTALAGMAGALVALRAPIAKAADKLRVGKAVGENFGYVPLDVGMQYGIFDKHGVAIEEIGFNGGAKIAQAMAAGAVDISLSAGPDMQFVAKGAPEIAVASITSSPAFMGLVVGGDAPPQRVDDLKGKKIGVASNGSLTFWMVDELNRVKGWTGDARATQVVIGGSTPATVAALKTGQVAASLSASQAGFLMEQNGEGRVLLDCSQYVPTLELFTIFASTALTQKNPDALRRFLAGWYEAVVYMQSHKDETVAIAAKVMSYPPVVAARSYDSFAAKFSTTGRFDPQAIEKLRTSFQDLGAIEGPVDLSKFYTEEFLPKRSPA